MYLREFLDLGQQPIANGFLLKEEFPKEIFYNLKCYYDEETHLVSIHQPDKNLLFHDSYAYKTGLSQTMIHHFKNATTDIKQLKINPRVLEIGSNDGTFIRNFSPENAACVEPCKNFAEITNNYRTYNSFWNKETVEKILLDGYFYDVVFAANCISHIPNPYETFRNVYNVLKSDGLFIIEDPSLLHTLNNVSYDQIYDEHAYLFSTISLEHIAKNTGFTLVGVKHLSVHGGTNRYIFKKTHATIQLINGYTPTQYILEIEKQFKLDCFETYEIFANKVEKSKSNLINKLITYGDRRIICYGATAKSTIVFNYCGIGPETINFIVDTTISKQDKYSPGKHIPVINPIEWDRKDSDVVFLGAWNYQNEIISKESFKPTWITHVPIVRVIS